MDVLRNDWQIWLYRCYDDDMSKNGKRVSMEIILEAASNHEGDMDRAREMIRQAASLGVDTIKFQSYRSETLRSDVSETEEARRRKFQLSDQDHYDLKECCQQQGISFLTTCFDRNRVPFLKELGIRRIKIASPDCASKGMIEDLKEFVDEFIVSTGMSLSREVDQVIEQLKDKKLILLHCVSLYPTPPEKSHLKRLEMLKTKHPRIGFSDHSLGIEVAKVAMSRGICLIEKHFTIDKSLKDFGHTFSLDLSEARALVAFREFLKTVDGDIYSDCLQEEKLAREKFIGLWGNNR
jgi:sialic acid synthase SpsE